MGKGGYRALAQAVGALVQLQTSEPRALRALNIGGSGWSSHEPQQTAGLQPYPQGAPALARSSGLPAEAQILSTRSWAVVSVLLKRMTFRTPAWSLIPHGINSVHDSTTSVVPAGHVSHTHRAEGRDA